MIHFKKLTFLFVTTTPYPNQLMSIGYLKSRLKIRAKCAISIFFVIFPNRDVPLRPTVYCRDHLYAKAQEAKTDTMMTANVKWVNGVGTW